MFQVLRRSSTARGSAAAGVGLATLAVLAVVAGGAGAITPPNLTIEKDDAPDPVTEGQVLTYTITVDNEGGITADNVVVTDKLSTRLDFVSASAGCAIQGRIVTCNLGSVAQSDPPEVVTIEVRPNRAGQVNNTAEVTASNDPTDATDPEQTTVTAAPPSTPRCNGSVATIVGTPNADVLLGTPQRDVIAARAGNDVVRALEGKDQVCGQRGGDLLKGQADADVLKGGRGPDRLRGGGGDDLLIGGLGIDSCRGGLGDDTRRSCERR